MINDSRATPKVIKAMREWLEDCDFDGTDRITDNQVLILVARNYDGGNDPIGAFIKADPELVKEQKEINAQAEKEHYNQK